jgi:ATP-dependent helicase HrpB
MPVREQDRVLRPCRGGERRVVLATDIAETSLTIEGVTAVVDSGLTRKPRFHAGSGLSRLVTEPISLAAAHQRAGRAGRLGPGTCYRLWSRSQESGRPPLRPAEITQADLTPLVLELALWGVSDPARLSWLDPPPPAAWGQAANLLRSLGALDESGSITPFGRSMAEFPVHPRLARMLVGAPPGASRRVAADLAALLSDRDPWLDAPGESRPADLGMRLRALESFRSGASVRWTERSRLAAADRLSRNLLRNEAQVPEQVVLEPGALLALAYPDRVAKRRNGGAGRYLMAGGSGAILPSDDALGLKDLLVIADVEGHQREGRIRLALPIAPAELRSVLGPRIEWVDTIQWDPDRQAVTARREERLGALTLSSRNQPLADPKRSADLLLEQIGKGFDAAFDRGPGVRQLQGRVALMRHLEPNGGWPDLSDDWLRSNPRQWLTPWLAGVQSLADLRALDLAAILRSRLDWAMQRRLDEEAPTELTTPARTRRRLDYTDGENPVLAVPLQEMFGAQATPRICSGRVTVTLHLLSPARRPLQVTRDLSAFWQGSYADVRKEMRGRYPKHHWPERPTEERPVAGGLKRRR